MFWCGRNFNIRNILFCTDNRGSIVIIIYIIFEKLLYEPSLVEFNLFKLCFDIVDADTWIFPLVQMGQLNICHDSEVTLKLLQMAPTGATLKLATGYFNLTSDYSQAVLRDCQATCHLLTAHPTANGFFSMCFTHISH